ncbi:MAG TPA: 16S rRNA (guanine(527)-N(7))-methyltransferase RsmG [Candidatus Saccharimonadales bacterium]|jgi:16S rRNA (guanine527-N7)-methyltransferase|nr:16S rRNA (guanine(527)-N(7))-methyltransferase RsmG [Candidatus Saccharimonadales bacterium]
MPKPPVLPISNQQISQALSVFGISASNEQIAKIREYVLLLLKWNQSISLTTVTDPDEIVSRHFGESMFANKVIPVENCRLADVGTGAGFPGLPLKILSPAVELVLIESNKKKYAFLSEVVRNLGLKGIEIVPDRFEQIRAETLQVDLISSRALGDFKELLRWSARALKPGGNILLWVGAEDATRLATNSSWIWEPATRIPDSQRRFILLGRPKLTIPGNS